MPTILTMAPDDLSARIKSAIESIADPIRQAADAIPGYDLERVTFTLAITSSGEVSLLSLVKGGASVQTGIQITLTPKARQ